MLYFSGFPYTPHITPLAGLRTALQETAEAERMFSVLMGEDVERRRQFIEEHALEVKNLDV